MKEMKEFSESNGVWQELLPSPIERSTNDFLIGLETPNSTVNTENGKSFLNKMKSQMSNNSSKHSIDGQVTPVYKTINGLKQTKIFPGRIRKRIVLKNGNVNLSKEKVEKRSQKYLQDTFTTMVDIQWRWNLLVFAMGFFLSWFAFAIVWWLIAYAHGDLKLENINNETWTSCVANVKSFASAFLFSHETQHTIGYGSKFPTEECPIAIIVMCIQSITGVMIHCFMVGFIFAKLSRPQQRLQTLMFSRNAVVCLRDGRLCLMFRIGN